MAEQGSVVKVEIKIDDAKPREYTGTVFFYDPAEDGRLILEMKEAHGRSTYIVVNNRSIISLTELQKPKEACNPVVVPATSEEIAARMQESMAILAKRKAMVNVDVTEEGRAIMVALSKTYECVWDGDSILVPEVHVRIKAPYRPDDVTGEGNAVSRLRMVVGRTREQLNLE
ncbi:Anticodon-binding domain [Carpediemonas membranifera]|uniref:Anticodon-binding domain n=1 Tax=Carpediemonas membranifera TaxID=201153 RepID=A0A8J6E9R3_9EUKA|nr:Anticodon-binding domain [Carpediemonas membranifera]|eukprot:KAG9393700.1 Anticodon-binding domain [Carpediemonas membranifera]